MSQAVGVPPLDAPEHLRPILAHAITGQIPPNVAVMQLLLHSSDIVEIEAALERTMEILDRSSLDTGTARLRQVAALLERHPEAPRLLQEIMRQVPHVPEGLVVEDSGTADPIPQLAQLFDAAFDISPEASVALYSLGNRDLLDIATAEIVRYLRDLGVLGPECHLLDIGCGFGRMLEALAGEAATLVGVDISERMVAAARTRCETFDNVHVLLGSGHELQLPDESIDLAIAVDVFPYIVLSGSTVLSEQLNEIGRVVKPGGNFIVFNYSYRNDPELDEVDLANLGGDAGFTPPLRSHARFHTWDATVFRMTKRANARA